MSTTPLSDILDQPTEWLWPGYIPLGGITMLDGDPGVGKSSVTSYLAAVVSNGGIFFRSETGLPPANVLVYQSEDPPGEFRRRVQANHGALERIHTQSLLQREEEALRLPAALPVLFERVRQLQARLLIIDPIADFFTGSLNNDQSVRRILRPLAAMASQQNVAVVLVRHLNQSGGGNPLYRGSGCSAIIGTARSGLLVAPEPGGDQRRLLVHYKSNLAPRQNTLSFQLEGNQEGRRVEFQGISNLSASDVLSIGTWSSALEEAIYFLFSLLGEGPLPATEVGERARRQGNISRSTLQRAKQAMGVRSPRQGFGRGSRLYWQLPEEHALVEHLRNRELDNLADMLFYPPQPPHMPEAPDEFFDEEFEDEVMEDEENPAVPNAPRQAPAQAEPPQPPSPPAERGRGLVFDDSPPATDGEEPGSSES